MRKFSWLLAAVGGVALVSAAAVQGVAASDGPTGTDAWFAVTGS